MRVISTRTLKQFLENFPLASKAILSWYEEAEKAEWKTPNELKQQYKNVSILSDKRVVFNIYGNSFRLIVDIEYRLKIVFVIWFGTHKQYDKIDSKTISYVKANKK
jgi:mRNA interferase HigB